MEPEETMIYGSSGSGSSIIVARSQSPTEYGLNLLMQVPYLKSKYNNWLIAKLMNIFTDVEERMNEREESLALMQAPS